MNKILIFFHATEHNKDVDFLIFAVLSHYYPSHTSNYFIENMSFLDLYYRLDQDMCH